MVKLTINKILFIALVTTSSFAIADDSFAKQIDQTREGVCFNHPDKKLCKEGINNLMRAVLAASEVIESCHNAKKLGAVLRPECDTAEQAINSIR